MQPSLEKLRKFFRLEHSNRYADKAVIGGLANILNFWEGEARQDGLPEEIIQDVAQTLKDYASQTPETRAEALKALWKRIQQAVPEAVAETAKKTRPSKALVETTVAPVSPSEESGDETAVKPSAPAVSSPAFSKGKDSVTKRPIALNASLTVLSGVGPKNAAMLARLGLRTLGDMLYHFPRRYEDYTTLKPIRELRFGEQVTVIGTVSFTEARKTRDGKTHIFEVVIQDGTGGLRLTFFNQPWLINRIKSGDAIAVSGKIEQYLGRLVMNSPEWEPIEMENLVTNRIVPVYPLTQNVTQKWMRRLMHQVVTYWAPKLTDHLPEEIRQAAGVVDLGTALLQIHWPETQEQIRQARQRLAFDEIFLLQVGVLRQRRQWQDAPGRVFEAEPSWLAARLEALPFALTGAQQRALDAILQDLRSGKPMNRLLQGDVGSGKTIVAALVAALVAHHGAQSAVMAPTSILAEQHYRTFLNLLTGERGPLLPEQVRLLVGDTPEQEKEEIRAGLESGDIKIVLGTHALLEEPVVFADLQFIVVDEQHRFGVEQRAALRAKGAHPHCLVMTATPIPRSLALTLYGDLDLTILDELPPGRQPIPTYLLRPQERERAYSLIRSQVRAGHQAYIVYPLIEESEHSDLLAATQEHERLQQEVFPDLRIGLLHGRMRPADKEEVMRAFRDREFDILVSTTVVEVGVDVPNATVMLIEGANRFGLAQLHQLRGRVGRGAAQSFCLLIPEREDVTENERLQAMVETNDGFVLAERDLQQRGPGEFLGIRQAGFVSSLKMASLSDTALIETARRQAITLFERDPELQAPENRLLAEALARFWRGGRGDIS
ncbi:MAG: ATP-dependent DNA helicase RecG [Anaerolineales bacterium]|nr:ATP-dependent DNA helicase RecG [Anaerolineales bacterium]